MENNKELTAREKQVLTGMGEGGTRENIAELLKIEKTTVDKHIEAIYRKYGVQEKGGALLYGVYKNDIDLDAIIATRSAKKQDKNL